MKNCIKCNKNKELDQFYLHKEMNDGHLNKCVSCCRIEATANYNTKDREALNTIRRKDYRKRPEQYDEWRIKKKYGITKADVKIMLEKQNNVCAICKKPGKLVIDHNHKNNKVRGLLHRSCNSALGLLLDSSDIVLNAASYLAMDGI